MVVIQESEISGPSTSRSRGNGWRRVRDDLFRRSGSTSRLSGDEHVAGPARAMMLAHGGDSDAYRQVLHWSEQWLRIFYEDHRPHLARDEVEASVRDALEAVHRKRHTFDGRSEYGRWLEAIARHKAPVRVVSVSLAGNV